MDEIKNAHKLFYEHKYCEAEKLFEEAGSFYEAGMCAFLTRDLKQARKFFEISKNSSTAASFGLIIIDLIEGKKKQKPKYFQVRCFLEIFLNLLIENQFFDWAQIIVDNYEYFMQANFETPKFIARVLYANNYNGAVHAFAKLGKEVCFTDAEIHYIDACVYIDEAKFELAEKCLEDCLTFAPEYYPVLKLKKELESSA